MQLRNGSQVTVNWGDGLTTPVTIIGRYGDQYKIAHSIDPWQSNSKISNRGNTDCYTLDYQGHQVPIDIISSGNPRSKISPILNEGWVLASQISLNQQAIQK